MAAGMNDGSFWPSPSSVTMIGARAAITPERSAADWPQATSWRMIRSQVRDAICCSNVVSVPSVEPSLTKITSKANRPDIAAAISSMSGAIFSASLLTGTTIDTSGEVLSLPNSTIPQRSFACPLPPGSGAGLLGTAALAGNHLDAVQRGAGQRHDAAVRCNRKAQPSCREPVAHHDGPESAHQRTGDHVARVMHRDDEAARRDGHRI